MEIVSGGRRKSCGPAEPWIVRSGRWLTKRRGILLSPLFATALLAARPAPSLRMELVQDAAGFLCLIAGTWLRLVAASYHDSSHGTGPITAGPYAWIRHPLYVANFLLGLGIVVLAGWWPMVGVYVLFFLPLHWVIARSEEVHLAKLYGPEYTRYCRSVPAFFPWRPYSGPRQGERNDFKLRHGQESIKVFGYLCGVAALILLKRFRPLIPLPPLAPLPILHGLAAAGLAVVAIVFRPKIRWAWLRACQTAIAVVCILIIVIHLPGVWVP